MDTDALMFADVTSNLAEGERFLYPVGELSEPMTWAPIGMYQDFAKFLHLAGLRQVPPLDIVVGRYLLATPDDAWPILKQLYQAFGGSLQPVTLRYEKDGFLAQIWARETKPVKKNAPTLVKSKELTYRVLEDRSFIWAIPLITIWPPPFTTGVERHHDLGWHITLEDKHPESEVIRVLAEHLEGEAVGAFFAVVHPILP